MTKPRSMADHSPPRAILIRTALSSATTAGSVPALEACVLPMTGETLAAAAPALAFYMHPSFAASVKTETLSH